MQNKKDLYSPAKNYFVRHDLWVLSDIAAHFYVDFQYFDFYSLDNFSLHIYLHNWHWCTLCFFLNRDEVVAQNWLHCLQSSLPSHSHVPSHVSMMLSALLMTSSQPVAMETLKALPLVAKADPCQVCSRSSYNRQTSKQTNSSSCQ